MIPTNVEVLYDSSSDTYAFITPTEAIVFKNNCGTMYVVAGRPGATKAALSHETAHMMLDAVQIAAAADPFTVSNYPRAAKPGGRPLVAIRLIAYLHGVDPLATGVNERVAFKVRGESGFPQVIITASKPLPINPFREENFEPTEFRFSSDVHKLFPS